MERVPTPATRLKQQERAERILDAATDLLLRWGYKRVTIDDVARQTGIGTGTIYLHWKTKDALFQTVLLREMVAVWRSLLVRIQADPAEVQLHRMMRALLLITMSRPLARACFTGDSELLGKLAQIGNAGVQRQNMIAGKDFAVLLRNLGLMRSDRDLSMQLYAFSAAVTGFFLIDPLLTEDEQIPLEGKAEALAQTVRDAFEPEMSLSPMALQEAASTLCTLFEQLCDNCEQQIKAYMAT